MGQEDELSLIPVWRLTPWGEGGTEGRAWLGPGAAGKCYSGSAQSHPRPAGRMINGPPGSHSMQASSAFTTGVRDLAWGLGWILFPFPQLLCPQL